MHIINLYQKSSIKKLNQINLNTHTSSVFFSIYYHNDCLYFLNRFYPFGFIYNMIKNKKQFHLTTINIDYGFNLEKQTFNANSISQILKHRKTTPKNVQNFIKNKHSLISHASSKQKQYNQALKIGQNTYKFHPKFEQIQIHRQSFKRFLKLKQPSNDFHPIKQTNPKIQPPVGTSLSSFLTTGKLSRFFTQQMTSQDNLSLNSSKVVKCTRFLKKSAILIKQKTRISSSSMTSKKQPSSNYSSKSRPLSASVQPKTSKFQQFNKQFIERERCVTLQPWQTREWGNEQEGLQ